MVRGKPAKKITPPLAKIADTKRTGDPEALLPGGGASSARICWRFVHVDQDGPWATATMTAEAVHALLAQLTAFESMTIDELFHRGDYPGKCYDVHALPNKSARERLEAVGLADMTRIWRLRIGGTGRLYGFLIDNVFHVLWWDPQHEVWPSKKRHT